MSVGDGRRVGWLWMDHAILDEHGDFEHLGQHHDSFVLAFVDPLLSNSPSEQDPRLQPAPEMGQEKVAVDSRNTDVGDARRQGSV